MIHVHCAISETDLVWQSSVAVGLIWGVHLTWVYVHCAILDSVALGATRGMSDLGICALYYLRNCFGIVGVQSDLSIFQFCYIGNCFGVVGLCSI